MRIVKQADGRVLTAAIEGSIDKESAPDLEREITEDIYRVDKLVLDLKGVDYISSEGLRALLIIKKDMDDKGELNIVHVSPGLMDIFEVTGFLDILTV